MAIALVSNAIVTGGASGGTTSAINTTGATLLVAFISSFTDSAVTVSDSKGNTWVGLTVQTAVQPHARIYYAVNPTVGTGHTFTCSGSSIYSAACFAAFSGVVTTSPFDVQNGQSGGAQSNTTARPGNMTPSVDGELVIVGVSMASTETVTAPSGFAITNQVAYSGGVNFGGAMAYAVQTTATTTNPLFTGFGADTAGGVVGATFKPAAGGATVQATASAAFGALTGTATATVTPAAPTASPVIFAPRPILIRR
jgi:hypothetical protein